MSYRASAFPVSPAQVYKYAANKSAPCMFRGPWQGALRCCHGCARTAFCPQLLPSELPQQSAFFRGGGMRLSRSLSNREAMRDIPQAGQTTDNLRSQEHMHHVAAQVMRTSPAKSQCMLPSSCFCDSILDGSSYSDR